MRGTERKFSRQAFSSFPSNSFRSLRKARKSERSSANFAWRSSAAVARSSGRSRGSCTESAAAMINSCSRQPSARAATSMRPTRGSRQPGEFAAELRKLVAFIDGTELREQCIAVGDCARRRRIEEGKLLDVAQAEALCPQDYRREGRAQQLRIWECRTLLEVLFGIQANADALRNASAT